MNMNLMDRFNDIADRVLVPIADKIGNQRHINAIKNGMAVCVPLSILGGMCLILSTPPFTPDQLPADSIFTDMLMVWYTWAKANAYALKLPFNMTMAMMGLFVSFSIPFNLAKSYKIPELNAAIISCAVFLLVSAPALSAVPLSSLSDGMVIDSASKMASSYMSTQFLDAKGIFTAIIVGIGCVEIMNFMLKRDIRFKMPEGVPSAISSSFDAILPLFTCVILYYSLSLVVQSMSGQLIPSMIMTMLAPAMSGLDSLPGIIIITVIAQTFWFFGLHGASITQFVRLPFMDLYIMNNAAAFAANEPIVHFFTQPFWSYVIALGGGGATLGLCLLLVRSKSIQLKQLGRIAIIPAFFNINEPIIFGLPLVLNPLMVIPFIMAPVINSIIAYTCMALGIVGKGIIVTPWTTPAPLGAALGCMDIKAGIMVIGLIFLDLCIYYPFFKIMEKQKLLEESASAE